MKNQPASLLPGGITYISGMVSQGRAGFAPAYQDYSGKTFPPKKLIREVDQAYFRQSLREGVNRWLARRGFDRAQRTIPKHLLDAAVLAEFGQLPSEPEKHIEKGAAKAKACKPASKKKRRKAKQALRAGAPEQHDWEEGELFVMQQLKDKGNPLDKNNQVKGWKTISDVAKLVRNHLGDLSKDGVRPDMSTARGKVSDWIEKFERSQAIASKQRD